MTPKLQEQKRRAVIDIGTVTTRLVIADCDGDRIDTLLKKAVITDLGEGLTESGYLSSDGLYRVGQALKSFKSIIGDYNISIQGDKNLGERNVIAIATSAARDAKDSKRLHELLAGYGLSLEIISGQREAQIAYLGATNGFAGSDILVCDIGGGSTELIFGRGNVNEDMDGVLRHSFNVGCRRVTEMFLKSDPVTAKELQDAREWTSSQFSTFKDAIDTSGSIVSSLIGIAGTATSIVSLLDEMEVYDFKKVHGRIVKRSAIDELFEKISTMTVKQRKFGLKGLQPGREVVIVAGLLIMQEVMTMAGVDNVIVSESDGSVGLLANWPDCT